MNRALAQVLFFIVLCASTAGWAVAGLHALSNIESLSRAGANTGVGFIFFFSMIAICIGWFLWLHWVDESTKNQNVQEDED